MDVMRMLLGGSSDRDVCGNRYSIEDFDAIHASPPCQAYSRLRHLPWLKDRVYWDSIPPTRKLLENSGLPWVMENVEDAPLGGIVLCGQSFGLTVFRHRRFESSICLFSPSHEKHIGIIASGSASMGKRYASSHVGVKEISRKSIAGHMTGVKEAAKAMGVEWMKSSEIAQAIPPVYTEYIGRQLIAAIQNKPDIK